MSYVSQNQLRDDDPEERTFLTLLNDLRLQHGLRPLVSTARLNQVAYEHSRDMGQRAYFDHVNCAGQSPFDRMREAGYRGGSMAENIASGGWTAADAFRQWANSPGHRANMLEHSYGAIGIGRALVRESPAGVYWTTVFGDLID